MLNKKNGLSVYRQRKVMLAFAVHLAATKTALFGLDRKTVIRYCGLFGAAIHASSAVEKWRKRNGIAISLDAEAFLI